MSLEITFSPSFTASPFGSEVKPFSEEDWLGREITIPPGTSIPDYVRRVYGTSNITPFEAPYSFLDRDNKSRQYDARSTDPFIFSGQKSISEFKQHALKLITVLMDEWRALGLPITRDKPRGIDVPDSETIIAALDSKHPLHKIVMDHRDDIAFIVSNVDICKKFCLVRTVTPGWWIVSYAGRKAKDAAHFGPALRLLVEHFKKARLTPTYKKAFDETFASQGDPLDTNTGYPLFSAAVDKEGRPLSKLMLLDMFKNIAKGYPKLDRLKLEMTKRTTHLPIRDFPFAIAPIRRNQPGWKAAHNFTLTSHGLVTKDDSRGQNTNRVAWMASYFHNLLLSPLQTEWKTLRKLTPGLFHDGPAKERTLNYIKTAKPYSIEADYSNYDRTIPINMFLAFAQMDIGSRPHGPWMLDILKQMHYNVPIIWPDYVQNKTGRGWVFKPESLALLSGLKVTSEEGTIINALVVIQSYLDSGVMTEDEMRHYLHSGIANYGKREWTKGDTPIRFLIQSDDTYLMDPDVTKLCLLTKAFVANAKRAGIKASAEFGDRFLMRHLRNGVDSPVPSRVWQNTLSNEEPSEDPLKFLVGLASRTDGLVGYKTVDAFRQGKYRNCSKIELRFTLAMLNSIHHFVSTSATVIPEGVRFVTTLRDACAEALSSGRLRIRQDHASSLDKMRNTFTKALAQREVDTINKYAEGVMKISSLQQSMLYSLHKNAAIPSYALLLEEIKKLAPEIDAAFNRVTAREHTFYMFAMDKIGLSPFFPS